VLNHFLVNGLPGLHQLMRDLIRLDQMRAACHKHLAHHGLPAGDPAREPDLQQSNPL
jgi:hypothetical protein